MADIPTHFDILGRPVELDSIVSAEVNGLRVCKVVKIHPKQIRVIPVTDTRASKGNLVYANQCTLLPEGEATMYILKNVKVKS